MRTSDTIAAARLNGDAPRLQTRTVDVAVLGSHVTTNLLAAILARHGLTVALVPMPGDADAPAGETTVPYTAELFLLLGTRFDVPEIADLAMFDRLPPQLRRSCGVKRSLSFLYHRRGRSQDPREAVQFHVPGEHAEWHLHRPAVDAYTQGLALSYGAVLAAAPPQALEHLGDRVRLLLGDDEALEAACVVDGAARPLVQAPLAPGARHRTRLMTTRMRGVMAFERRVPLARYEHALPFSEGTVLHVFDGGWIQLAPFDNHPEAATGECAVTVSVDPERYPWRAETPDEHLMALLAELPDVRGQFAGASRTRPWHVEESRIGERDAGPSRYVLFDRAALRHDLLLSRDLTVGLELVHAAAAGLLGAVARGEPLGHAALAPVRDLQHGLFTAHDRLVAAARTATGSFELFNAFLRVWLLWSILSALAVKRARLDAAAAGDWSALEQFERGPYWFGIPPSLPGMLDACWRHVEAAGQRQVPHSVAAARIFARLRHGRIVPPLYRFGAPDARVYRFTPARRLLMLAWVKTLAPAEFRRLLTPENVTGGRPAT
jgi:FADH2 O2-dependent halogenase